MDDPKTPRSEPEIIPPGVALPRDNRIWMSSDMGGTHRVYIQPLGPVGTVLLTLGIGAAATLLIVILFGAAVFGLATIGVLLLAGIIAGLLRGPARPLR